MSDEPISLRAYLRDLRWLAPLWLGVMLVIWAFDVGGMRDLGFIEAMLVAVGFVVVLGPLSWLWHFRRGRTGPALWKFLAGASVWAFVSLAVIVAILGALDVD